MALQYFNGQLQNGQNITAVYNEGEIYVPSSRNDGGNVVIWNAPRGVVNIVEPIVCGCCGTRSSSIAEDQDHVATYPHWCHQHRQYFSHWSYHLDSVCHFYCPIVNCGTSAGVDFGNNETFMQHWYAVHWSEGF